MPGVAPRGGKSNTRVAGGRRVVDIPRQKFLRPMGGASLPQDHFLFPPGPGAKCDYVLIKYRRGATGGGLPHWEGGVAWLGASPPRAFPVGSRASTLGS